MAEELHVDAIITAIIGYRCNIGTKQFNTMHMTWQKKYYKMLHGCRHK